MLLICLVFFYPLLGIVEFLVLFYDLECRMLELQPSVSCWSILWVLQDVTALISWVPTWSFDYLFINKECNCPMVREIWNVLTVCLFLEILPFNILSFVITLYNFSRLTYWLSLKSPSFRYLLHGKRRKVGPRTFSKRFSSMLSIYLEKSEFSLFVIGQKTKSRTSDFFQTFLVYVIGPRLKSPSFRYLL